MSNETKLYKGKYFIVFYDKTDEHFLYMFDNIREILKFQKKPLTRENAQEVKKNLYRALKSETHFVNWLIPRQVMRVYIIDNTEESE